MRTFDEKSLVDHLQLLPPEGRVAFAASCATRLFGAYVSFRTRTGLGDPAKLRAALDHVWDWVSGERKERSFYEQQLGIAMALIPKENAEWTPLHAYAEDAVSATAYAIRTILTKDPREAAWAANCVYEALDHQVISRKTPDLNSAGAEGEIASDPLIQAELSRQRRDIEELQAVGPSKDKTLVERFRARAKEEQAIGPA